MHLPFSTGYFQSPWYCRDNGTPVYHHGTEYIASVSDVCHIQFVLKEVGKARAEMKDAKIRSNFRFQKWLMQTLRVGENVLVVQERNGSDENLVLIRSLLFLNVFEKLPVH